MIFNEGVAIHEIVLNAAGGKTGPPKWAHVVALVAAAGGKTGPPNPRLRRSAFITVPAYIVKPKLTKMRYITGNIQRTTRSLKRPTARTKPA